jgi:hypothetical protein
MHPEILRLINDQRSHELRTRAHQARLVRMIKSARRGHGPDEADEFVLPRIPDYVDGSFRAEGALPADSGALSPDGQASGTGHAAAAQRAA